METAIFRVGISVPTISIQQDPNTVTTELTVKHLLTHTSGLAYDLGDGLMDRIYGKADLWNSPSLEEFTRRVGKLPLAHQPGEAWLYGVNTDILGRLVEVVSGVPFDRYLEEKIDPVERTLVLLFIQHFPYNEHGIFHPFSTLCYQALVD